MYNPIKRRTLQEDLNEVLGDLDYVVIYDDKITNRCTVTAPKGSVVIKGFYGSDKVKELLASIK